MQYLQGREIGEIQELNRAVTEGEICADGEKVIGRYDFRAYFKARMEEEGISNYAMAKFLGMPRCNFNNFMKGKGGVLISTLEQMFWILQPNNFGVDEEDAPTRIIKEETL